MFSRFEVMFLTILHRSYIVYVLLYMQLTVNGEHGKDGVHAQGRVMVAGGLVPVKC